MNEESNGQANQDRLIDHVDQTAGDKAETSMWHTFKTDKQYQARLLRTLCLGLGLFCVGATEAQNGATFLDIQIITKTDVKTASVYFTVHSSGYLTGCILAGFLPKRFRRSFLIFTNILGLAVVTIVTPFCFHLATMIIAKSLSGIFAGVADTYVNADLMNLWGNQGQVYMQMLHFSFALGGLLSPLVSAPFLAERENMTSVNFTFIPYSEKNTAMALKNDSYLIIGTTSSWNLDMERKNFINETMQSLETDVHYAFLITGIITLTASVPFLVLYMREIRHEKEVVMSNNTHNESEVTFRCIPKHLKFILVIILALFYIIYCGIEDTFANLLMTFLVKNYDDMSKSRAAHILAIFWSCFAASRFMMIFLAKRFTPLQLLAGCVCLTAPSLLIFTFVATYGNIVGVAVMSGIVAFSMSGTFAAGFSWSESEYLQVSNSISACILVASTLGVMLNPIIVIFAIEQMESMWFCYVFNVEVLMLILVLALMLIVNRNYVNRKYGALRVYMTHVQTLEEEVCI